MDMTQIAKLPTQDLRRLHARIARELARRDASERAGLLRQFKKLAAQKGLSLDQVMPELRKSAADAKKGGRGRGRQLKGMAPKKKAAFIYFHPTVPNKGWSGHGRRPQWVLDWQNAGKDIELLKQKPATN
ncbi:MAG: H-NS histone family protein [Rhodocyclaceae bacterium]|nr:H-NS histone family protein [Rhodocyclaceae bacterium]